MSRAPKKTDELASELSGLDAAVIAPLSVAERAQLLEAIRNAKRRHREALRAAIEQGMGFVPALLRIPLKRILFP